MTQTERRFIGALEEVSVALSVWAQEQIGNGWSVEDCKVALRAAAKVAGRN